MRRPKLLIVAACSVVTVIGLTALSSLGKFVWYSVALPDNAEGMLFRITGQYCPDGLYHCEGVSYEFNDSIGLFTLRMKLVGIHGGASLSVEPWDLWGDIAVVER